MKKVRWGILGTGRIAKNSYVPAIKASRNGELAAVASRDAAKAAAFATENGIPRSHGSYEALLADPGVDAVYVALPNGLHCEWSIKAAEAGKAVLCEKPLACDASEARRMAEAFRARNLPLAEAIMYKRHALNRTAIQILRDGRIGPLRMARASFVVDNQKADDIRFSKALGGGAMRDLGCYCASVLRWAAGEEPEAVEACALAHPNGGVDFRTAATLRFPSGVVASFQCGYGMAFECSYEFFGENGRILVDAGAMVAWPGGEFKVRVWSGGESEEIAIPPMNHYQAMAEELAAAVLEGAPLGVPLEDSIANMAVIDRVLAKAGF